MTANLKFHANEPAAGERLGNSLAALANHRRDAILEAIAVSAKELLRSLDLNVSLPKVAERVGAKRPNTMYSANTIRGMLPAFLRRPII